MANEILLSIDVKKIDKSKLRKNTWTDGEGEVHEELLLDVKVVGLKEKKFIKETEKTKMYKTHFAKEGWFTDEENFVGQGFQFELKEQKEEEPTEEPTTDDDINPEDIPF